MTTPKTPYSSDHKPPLTLAEMTTNARELVAGSRSRQAALEAENDDPSSASDAESQERINDLEELRRLWYEQRDKLNTENAELRRLLLALLAGLDSLKDNWGAWPLIDRAAGGQIAEARGAVSHHPID